MTATVMVMKIVTKRWLWAIRPWTADATAAGFTLSHPTTQRVATTIIAIDLIDRQDWPPAGKIADHSRLKSVITVVPCLADGRSGNAESESCRDEKDDFFHFFPVVLIKYVKGSKQNASEGVKRVHQMR